MQRFVINSMTDFNTIPTANCFYIITEINKEWGIYGRTKDIQSRFCDYLRNEPDAVTWDNNIHIYLFYSSHNKILNLETYIKRKLRKQRYDDLFVQNQRGNQLEFFPNEYLKFMHHLCSRAINSYT